MTTTQYVQRMRLLLWTKFTALAAGISAAVVLTTAPSTADPAISGLEFYTPSADLVPGPHGSVIRSRPLDSAPALAGARNQLVLYRSIDMQGNPVAVSGTVAVPQGTPPPGGWPLISWAHGTTGVADVCAPSRDTDSTYPAHDYTTLTRQYLERWIAAGYAVAQTDYQGLGTPGPHGYLIGAAEQRAVADIALAARDIDPAIGTRWVAIGHSQGGQAAVFTDALAAEWAPQLDLLGAVALAPASNSGPAIESAHLVSQLGAAALAAPVLRSAAAFVPLIVRGAQTVATIDTAQLLTPAADDLMPLADQGCIGQLRRPDQWGGLPEGQAISPTADTSGLRRVLDSNDPSALRLTHPLLVAQGRADTVVAPQLTDVMVARLTATGNPVDYRNYPDRDHRAILEASFADTLGWVDARFGR
ncbi:alpha/beta hydrolase family protein [Nocardia sp. NPDC127579]|uniref:alpha/beta hydrolase family protein n=1 Tax=Nocardia sp. NPDC127579 TaxID=3345402 RepID=UPI003636B26F